MQYLTLALDASCDLPKAIYQRFDLATLPLTWLAKPTELPPDNRSDATTEAWYQSLTNGTSHSLAEWSRKELSRDTHLSQSLDNTWLLNSDGALIITPAKHHHPGYDHWNRQAATLQPQLDRVRHAANLHSHFRLRVMDSSHILAAYGLLVQEVAHLHRDQGLSIDKLRLPLLAFSRRIKHLYSVPAFANPALYPQTPAFPTLNGLRRFVMSHRGTLPVFQTLDEQEELVGHATAADPITPVVDLACTALKQNRLNHATVNASFAGEIEPLHQHPAIRRLHEMVSQQGGHLWLSQMSGSSAIHCGENAFSVAFVN